MAAITSIISCVSWGSRLSLALYKFGASVPPATRDVNRIAKGVTLFCLTLKQIGATLREDDTVPSPEAYETVQEILSQCQIIFGEIEAFVPVSFEETQGRSPPSRSTEGWKWSLTSRSRMDYLLSHLESIKMTLSVMLQTFYTVKINRWTRTHPTISPARMADAIQNEKLQMEILIIEQQMSLLTASKLYDELRRSEAFSKTHLLENTECPNSLIVLSGNAELASTPTSLVPYQEPSLAHLDTSHDDPEGLAQVLNVSTAYIDHLLARWTRLRDIEERMDCVRQETEEQIRQQQYNRRRSQQPTVESDDSDDQLGALPGIKRTGRFAVPVPQRPGHMQPLFPDSPTLTISVPDSRFGSTAPVSSPSSQYGVSPRSSTVFAASPTLHSQSPQSPRTSISSLPVRADAALTAKDEDESVELGIPWRLCLKGLYWEYTDGKVERSNNNIPTSTAFIDRNAWTEIMASWVCREAIEEAGYQYTQIKKERNEGGRTKLETGFSISRPLIFAEVERLVERTVEMYRQRQQQRVRSPKRRSSSSVDAQTYSVQPRASVTPRANSPPTLDRCNTSLPFPLPAQNHPPVLDRATTFPGPHPNYNTLPYPPISLNTSHPTQSPSGAPQYSQIPPTTSRSKHHRSSFSASSPRTSTDLHASYAASTLSASTTSDSDVPVKSRTRRRSSSRQRRRGKGSSAVGTLAKVGGLAALLDGIVDVAGAF